MKKLSFLIGLLLLSSCSNSEPHISKREHSSQLWNGSLALQAASWGAPLVTMYTLRDHDALNSHAKARPNTIWRMTDISTPELARQAGYVTPNVNVVYGFGFMDLRQEPIILTVPDSKGRYYMVQIVDMWTNSFAYVGGKTTGYKGGTFALVGPGWKGTLPSGVTRIDCPTPWVLVQPRVHVYTNGEIDLPAAKEVLDQIQTVGLSQFSGKDPLDPPTYSYPVARLVNPSLPVSFLDFKDPLQFWDILMGAMNENPPPQEQIEALLPLFAPLGLEFGKPWDRTKIAPAVLQAMTQAAQNIAEILEHLPFGIFDHGAAIPSATIGDPQTDYKTRAVVARVGLTANTPYEAVYWIYAFDDKEKGLLGTKKYSITFKEPVPVYEPGFWSITMYDALNNYTIKNPIQRYMIGSDSRGLQKNPDGSFTIYIQHESPGKAKESNWLPAPDGPFYLIPRAYAPTPEAIEILTNPNSWPVPAVIEN